MDIRMKARYLTFFSYIGTGFRSSEKIWLKEKRNYPDPESIQGWMEIALLKLRSLNYPNLHLSSRTDGGVHALTSSAHFDLERYGEQTYCPERVTYQMNKFFYKQNLSINIKKCLRVSDNFSARHHAICRTYLFRLAILKDQLPESVGLLATEIPIEEWRRCCFMRAPGFDIERFKSGAQYFEGYHDFTTFKKFDKLKLYKHNRRQLFSITVKPGQPIVTSYSGSQNNAFQYWDIEIKGKSFVHNQIRRMIGTLISVATGKLPPEEIKVMLQVPSKYSWYNFIQSCGPEGLYLCNVEYNPEDLIYKPEPSNGDTAKENELDVESE